MDTELENTSTGLPSPEVDNTPDIQFRDVYSVIDDGRETQVSLFDVGSLGRSFRVSISSVLNNTGWADYSLCYLLSDEDDGKSLAIKARVNWTAAITASVLVDGWVNIKWRDVWTIFRRLVREGERVELSDWDQSTLLKVLQTCIDRNEPLQSAA